MQTTETSPQTLQLQPEDLTAIKNLLPWDYREQIAKTTGLTPRQVGEVFKLRTTNADHNKAVWSIIRRKLKALHQHELAEKAQYRILSTSI